VRRWMRTIPPYLFALILISIIVDHVGLADFVRYALYVENLVAEHNLHDYFPVAWSLSIEEWFYVAFPGLLMIAAWCFRDNSDRFAVLVAVSFIGAITAVRLLFGDLTDWGPGVRRVVVFRVDSIAYGFLLYMFIRRCMAARDSQPALLRIPAAAALFIMTASIAGALTWRIAEAQSYLAEILFPFAAAGFGMSAILLAFSVRHSVQHRVWAAESCYFLGRISYSLYLFHLSVAMIVAPQLAGLSALAQLAVYIGICVVLSSIFYRVFERPILAMRPGYRELRKDAAAEVAPLSPEAKPAV
jgi:peptidoglycan/LPS O-acetylase OafA/YrhL